MLSCRTTSYFTLTLTEQNANGVVFAADLYPYSGATGTQTIFALGDPSNVHISFTFEFYADGTLGAWSCCYGGYQ